MGDSTVAIRELMTRAGIENPLIGTLIEVEGLSDSNIYGYKTYNSDKFFGDFHRFISKEVSDKFLEEIKKYAATRKARAASAISKENWWHGKVTEGDNPVIKGAMKQAGFSGDAAQLFIDNGWSDSDVQYFKEIGDFRELWDETMMKDTAPIGKEPSLIRDPRWTGKITRPQLKKFLEEIKKLSGGGKRKSKKRKSKKRKSKRKKSKKSHKRSKRSKRR